MIRVQLRGLSLAWALCGAQMFMAATSALIVWVIWGGAAAMAALFGGFVAVVPVAYFAVKVYLRHGGSDASEVLGAFYRAEVGKLILTALLFLLGVLLFGKHFAPLILTCMACLTLNWLILAVASSD